MRDNDSLILEDLYSLILENNAEYLTLYRGDSSDIGTHSLDKGDIDALFGQGIYLTSNKRIAGDYKLKGSNEIIFRGNGFKTKNDVINKYIEGQARFIDKDGKENFFEIPMPYFTNDPDRIKRYEFAKEKWDEIKDQCDVRINADGTSAIFKKKAGNISIYKIPMDIINRTYDAENEIDQTVIDSICDSLRKTEQSCSILRDIIFKNEDGFLPTFRNVWMELRRRNYFSDVKIQVEFRKSMKSKGGFKGIEYAGGLTMGGGVKHRAFVFWDEQGLAKYREK
jgi:hypothetical protein